MEDASILDMNDPFEKDVHYNIFPKFCKFVLWINMLQFGNEVRRVNECGHFWDNHVLELVIFKSLNNFEG